MKNKTEDILTYIISISIILSAFLGSVHFWCFNENFYREQHDQIILYGKHINEHIGISNEQLDELTSFTLDYLNDPKSSLDMKMKVKGIDREVYTKDEKLHMEDVRKLNLNSVYIMYFSIACLLLSLGIYLFNKYDIKLLYLTFKKCILFFGTVFAFIGLWVLIDFDSFWTLFHKIFFTGNDLWILDLRKDILIMIVPPEFFNNLVITILISFVLIITITYFCLYYIWRKVND